MKFWRIDFSVFGSNLEVSFNNFYSVPPPHAQCQIIMINSEFHPNWFIKLAKALKHPLKYHITQSLRSCLVRANLEKTSTCLDWGINPQIPRLERHSMIVSYIPRQCGFLLEFASCCSFDNVVSWTDIWLVVMFPETNWGDFSLLVQKDLGQKCF